MAVAEATTSKLKPSLSGRDGIAVVIGVVIGAGILRTPGLIAGYLAHPTLILALWVAGGITALCTALILAELGAMIPAAGGKYAFVRRAYGDGPAAFAGWGEIALNRSFTGALKAVTIGQYVVILMGNRGSPAVVAGVLTIAMLCLHWRGVETGRVVQNTTTLLKVILLLSIIAVGLILGGGAGWTSSATPTHDLTLGFALAMQSIFFTYYGAEASLQTAEEMRDPQRTVPRMLLFGIGSITAIYLLMNIAFLNTLTPSEMSGSKLVAQDVLQRALGNAAGTAVAVAAIIVLLSSFNYNFLGSPRIPFGLARDGLAPAAFTHVNAAGTPTWSLLLTSGLIFVLAVTGTFELLIRFMSFLTLVVDGLVLTSLFALRRREPDTPRPFRVPLYPVVPALGITLYAGLLIFITVTQPKLALGGGLVLLALGLFALLISRGSNKA